MNRAYRHIWSAARGAYIIAAETARGNGGAGTTARAVRTPALVASLALAGIASAAAPPPATTVVPVAGQANAYISANGVPVVNINSANAAGVSHNQFTRYDVEAKGLVLNNSSFKSAPVVQSKLAGQLVGNLNLGTQAKIIVNEVVSTNRSTLAGYTEVAGGRADVIVANPYGITCNGCGFINSDRITLTTGVPGWGADGSFNGVNVTRGDIRIEGAGLNASAQQILDLVTRAVRIDGQVNTLESGSLGLYAGAQQWSYASREVSGKAVGADSAAEYAIDSTALGGMYAGRIRLIATEAGVGVRMLGDAAANADDFRLDAAGKVVLQSRVAAGRDILVAQAGNGAFEMTGASASLTAARNLAIKTEGALAFSEGLLKAGGNLAVTGASLTDTSVGATRTAGANVDITSAGAASVKGSSWGAGAHLALDAASLALDGTFYSGATASSADRALNVTTRGELNLAKGKLTGTDTMNLNGAAVRLGSGIEITAATDLGVSAKSLFDNAGQVVGGRAITLKASEVNNSGLLQAQTLLAIGAGQALQLSNSADGKLLGERVVIDATTLDNSGAIQGTLGAAINASGKVNNQTAGMLLTTAAGAGIRIKAAVLDNAGRVQSAGAIDAGIVNAFTNSGKVLSIGKDDGGSNGALAFQVGSLANRGMIVGAGAVGIASGAGLDNSHWIQADSLNLDVVGAVRNQGMDSALLARGAATIQAASLDNAGTVQAGAGLNASVTDTLTNSGALQNLGGATDLVLNGGAIANSGAVQAAGYASLTSATYLDNTGKLLAGGSADLTAKHAISNRGKDSVVLAQRGVKLDADSVNNDGAIQAGVGMAILAEHGVTNHGLLSTQDSGALKIAAEGVFNDGAVQGAGTVAIDSRAGIDTRGAITAGGSMQLKAVKDIDVGGVAQVLTKDGLTVTSANLTNLGTMQAQNGFGVTTGAQIVNLGTLTQLAGSGILSLAGSSVQNTGTVQGAGDAIVRASSGAISNSGKWVAQGSITFEAATAVINSGAGTVLASGALDSHSQSVDNQGAIQAGTRMGMSASGAFTNSGKLQNQSAASAVDLTAASITNSGEMLADGSLNLHVAGALDNAGAAARIVSQNALSISGNAGFTVHNSSLIQAAGNLSLGSGSGSGTAAAQFLNDSGATVLGSSVRIDSLDMRNQGRVQALGAGILNTGTLHNQGSGAVILLGLDGSASSIGSTSYLYNEGAIHGGGNLALTAPGISNTNSAGISSLGDLSVTSTGSGIVNAGALYAGNKLTVSAIGQNVINTSDGTMDATNIDLSAAGFDNYNTVIALADTSISTTNYFNNLPTGGMPTIVVASSVDHGVTVPFDSGEYACNFVGSSCDHLWVFAQTYTVTQGLDRDMPLQKGQVLAGGTINLNYGMSAVNRASLISAPTINISGSGSFTNVDLHLDRIEYVRRWRDYKTNSTFGSLNHAYSYPTDGAQFGCLNGACFTGFAGSGQAAADASFGLETGRTTIQKWSAGVYATNLNFYGGSLMNLGSPYAANPETTVAPASASGSAGSSPLSAGPFGGIALTKAAAVAAAGNPGSRAVSVPAANGVTFKGLNLALPTNPNGYFVTAKNPTSGFLVETNPLFGAGSNSVGSSYLSSLLGIDPDKQQKRLGDANYEAKLIRDQLVAQTGNNVLKGQQNEASQIKSLMENAARTAGTLGLQLGQPLSADQAAGLEEDMVWMVEQVVGGQKVLVPVVYLAQKTKDAIETGAVMVATNSTIKADTVVNKGGTIAADTLAIDTKGDLRNTGGTIKGGDVSIKAGGSIINETVAETNGGKDFARTVIGAAGSIQSTGSLNLDAAKDILVKGATIKAGGDASLAAGGNVTFDTIQDKSADATFKASQGLWGISSSSSSTHTATTTNIGSGIETGGGLKIKSGGDTTIAGSSVKTGGGLDLDAGGNVNIVSRQDTVETSVSNSRSGLGVGGGVYGSTTTTTDAFKGRNVGSSIDVGGDANINTAGTLTLQGSKLKVGGDAAITAGDVQVLAGQDVDRSSTTTSTTSFLKLSSSGDSHAGAGAEAGAKAGSGKANGNVKGSATASASAGAEAGASGSANLTLAETETTTTNSLKTHAVGSEIDIGGNLKVDSKKSIVLEGATVNAGGDVDLKAKDVKVLASQDVDITTSKTTTTQIGLYIDSDNTAQAGASASAGAKGKSNAFGSGGSAGAEAQANASAGSETTIDLVRVTSTESNSLDIRNNGSTINAGGKLKVNAENKLTVQGSDIGGDGGVSLKAKDQEFLAAEDVSVTSTSTTRTSAGLYISGGANAQASASAGANGQDNMLGGPAGSGKGEASASADAKAGAGWQAKVSTEKSSEGTTTARVSTIRSGSGDIERIAENKITDVGTAIEAAGDFTQSATTIDSRAAKNTTFSSSSSETNAARIGAYAQANAGAGTGEGGSANASAGVEASFNHDQSAARSDSSEAVVSTIKAGGKLTSKSTEKSTFEGTQIAGDAGVELEAGEIDFKAARNTESSSESSLSVNAAANIGLNLGSSGAVEGGLSGGFGKDQASSSASTAVVGGIASGGNLTIKTKGDARFEGTDIAAAGDAAVDAGGKLSLDAARNESTASRDSSNAQVSISVSKSKGAGGSEHEAGLEAEGGFSTERERSSEAVTGRIAAGGSLTLSAGKDMKFEGTAVEGGGDTRISAGGNVDFAAARNTSSSESTSLSVSLSASKSASNDTATGESASEKKGGIGAEFEYSREKSSEAVAGTVASGGKLQIRSGGNTTLEGTDVTAAGAASIAAGGNVAFKAAESTSESLTVGLAVGAEGGSSKKTGPSATPGAAAGAMDTVDEKEQGGSLAFEAGVATSRDKKAGSIQAGSIDISAGGNAALEGTRLKSDGDIALAAQGDVSITTAKSTSSGFGVSVGVEGSKKSSTAEPGGPTSGGMGGVGLELGAKASNEGASLDAGGKVSIASGGRTTLVSTQTRAVEGTAIAAAGGVVRSTARDVDTGFAIDAAVQSTSKPAAPVVAPAAPAPAEVKPAPPVKKVAAVKAKTATAPAATPKG